MVRHAAGEWQCHGMDISPTNREEIDQYGRQAAAADAAIGVVRSIDSREEAVAVT